MSIDYVINFTYLCSCQPGSNQTVSLRQSSDKQIRTCLVRYHNQFLQILDHYLKFRCCSMMDVLWNIPIQFKQMEFQCTHLMTVTFGNLTTYSSSSSLRLVFELPSSTKIIYEEKNNLLIVKRGSLKLPNLFLKSQMKCPTDFENKTLIFCKFERLLNTKIWTWNSFV